MISSLSIAQDVKQAIAKSEVPSARMSAQVFLDYIDAFQFIHIEDAAALDPNVFRPLENKIFNQILVDIIAQLDHNVELEDAVHAVRHFLHTKSLPPYREEAFQRTFLQFPKALIRRKEENLCEECYEPHDGTYPDSRFCCPDCKEDAIQDKVR